MTNDDGRKPEGAPERSAKAGVGAPLGVEGNSPKRFSAQRKMAIVVPTGLQHDALWGAARIIETPG